MDYPDALRLDESPWQQRVSGPQLLEVALPANKSTDLDEVNNFIQDWLYDLGIPAHLHTWSEPRRKHWYSPRRYVTRWNFFGRHIPHEVGTAWVIARFYMLFPHGYARFIREW